MSSEQLPIADLELDLSPQDGQYLLRMRLQLADGRTSEHFDPCFVRLDEEQLRILAMEPETYGVALTTSVFAEAGPRFREALRFAAGGGHLVRLRLALPDNLHQLRWEMLQEPDSGRPLARDGSILLSRYLGSDELLPVKEPPAAGFRALVAVAAPVNLSSYNLYPIDAPAEIARIRNSLSHTELVTLGEPSGAPATWEAISDALRAGCDMLYLVAHGDFRPNQGSTRSEPWLFFEDPSRHIERRPGRELVELLRSLGSRRPSLIVLASCESAGSGFEDALAALGPQLARAGVPAVVAMQGKVSARTAQRFATVFFEEVRRDGLVDRAVNAARLAVAGQPDWWMPVLYTRLQAGGLWSTQQQRSINNAPPLPPSFIGRPDLFGQLVRQLTTTDRRTTAAMIGGGGFGKTALALALCHDDHVRTTFPDGILWVELGEKPELLRLLNAQIRALGGQGVETEINDAAARLRELLEHNAVVLVLDNVWNAHHARPFLQRTEKTRATFLLTTRLLDVVNGLSIDAPVAIEEMTDGQSLQLLAAGLVEADGARQSLRVLARRLGYWALALELANGVLRKQSARYGLAVAIERLNEDLDDEGFTMLDLHNAETPNQSLASSLNISLKLLDEDEQRHFIETVICREGMEIPVTTLSRLWDMPERRALRLCETLADISLVTFSPATRAIRLHDVIRQVLAARLQNPVALHAHLINRYGDLTSLPDTYAWQSIAYHLVEARRTDALKKLLLNVEYLHGKLLANSDIHSLIEDCERLASDNEVGLLRTALTISASVIETDRAQLLTQLYARLLSHRQSHGGIDRLLDAIAAHERHPALLFTRPSLQQAGGPLIRTIRAHQTAVRSVALSADSRLALSGSDDMTLRLWNIATGQELRAFTGHTGAVNSVALSADQRLALSGSADSTLKLWDVATGNVIHTFTGHTGAVNSVALSADQRLALSGSADTTLKLWDVTTGNEIRTLRGHRDPVSAVALNPQGQVAASGSGWRSGKDFTLRVWDVAQGVERFSWTLDRTDGVRALAFSADSRLLLSGSADLPQKWQIRTYGALGVGRTLHMWDLESQTEIKRFATYAGSVNALAISPDGRSALTGSREGTVALWDLTTGAVVRELEGRSAGINAVALRADGQIALAGTADGTILVWDMHIETPKLRAPHHQSVAVVAISPDGRFLLSGAHDGALKIWNLLAQGEPQTFLAPDLEPWRNFSAIAISSDSRYALARWENIDWDTHLTYTGLYLIDIVAGTFIEQFDDTPEHIAQATLRYGANLDEARRRSSVQVTMHDQHIQVQRVDDPAPLCSVRVEARVTTTDISPDCIITVGDGAGQVHILRPNRALLRLLTSDALTE